MTWRNLITVLLVASNGMACAPSADEPSQYADVIFIGDNIVTMDESVVGAVAVAGDRILAAGSSDDMLALSSNATRVVELGEHALLPGFIDAHGHFLYVGLSADLANLSSPPVGPVVDIDSLVGILRSYIAENSVPAGEWVYGYGYDDSLIAEKRHPDRDDLDRVSTEHPIVISHVSGHLASGNSAALAASGIDAGATNPDGGVIRRRPGSDVPNGVMEETALGLYPSSASGMSPQRQLELFRVALDIHASYGLTTVQDGGAELSHIAMMRAEAARETLAVDVVAFPWVNSLDDEALSRIDNEPGYLNGFRVGGVKFGLDGSPQGRTAWLSKPYTEGPPGEDEDFVAYPTYAVDTYNARMKRLIARGVPVLAHANGDAAIDMMIDGVAAALEGGAQADHRSVVIHGQLMREDQLVRVKQLGIVPSYFVAHPFFWGDWHRLSFGDERASFISPLKATIDRGIPFTIHNDAPIVPPDIMRLVWVAVNRKTRSGYVLGPDQRVTVMEALHAVTQGAAYQYFEEDEKGSITPGKRADLVVLDANPLKVDVDDLKDISVVETISRGRTVYRQPK